MKRILFVVWLAACGADGGMGTGGEPNGATVVGTQTWLRFANFVPAEAGFDVCIQDAAGTFQGPLFARAGLTSGLSYGLVSQYLEVPASGKRRFVAAGATCQTPLGGLPDGAAFTLAPGAHGTVFVYPGATGPIASDVHLDFHDPTGRSLGSLRYAAFSPGLHTTDAYLDVGQPVMLARGARFGEPGSGEYGTLMRSGEYVVWSQPLQGVGVDVDPAGVQTEVARSGRFDLIAGKTWSVFLIGDQVGTSPLELRVCDDYVREGPLTRCY
jgi:hypothetical protein